MFALLGFLGAVTMTDLAGALVLGGGLLAGAAALPRVGRVLVPAAVIATVAVEVGLLQAVVANRGGGGLLIAATAVAVLTWLVAVVAALMDAGVLDPRPAPGRRNPRAGSGARARSAVGARRGLAALRVPADPTMTYVGRQPDRPAGVGRSGGRWPARARGRARPDRGVRRRRSPRPRLAPAYAAAFGQSPAGRWAGADGGVRWCGSVRAGVRQSPQTGWPDPPAVFGGVGQSAQAGGPEPTAVFGQSPQAGVPEPAAVFGQSPQAGGPDPTAVFGQLPKEGAPEQAGA